MSTQKTKEELVRLAWIAALRREGHRQCTGAFHDANGGVCALGLLIDVAGLNLRQIDFSNQLADVIGFQANQMLEVMYRNDGRLAYHRHTFSEIADVIESWFAK